MEAKQEPKYRITNHGQLVNRQSSEAIPDDEPVFVLRAKDRHAAKLLGIYQGMVLDPTHRQAISLRATQFADWALAHPNRMKEPDTILTDDWKAL